MKLTGFAKGFIVVIVLGLAVGAWFMFGDAIKNSEDFEQLKEGIEPYACSEVWFMGFLGHQPNVFIDITSTLEKKVEAALRFEATLTLLADLFAPNIDPANIKPEQMKKLTRYANRLLRSVGTAIGTNVDLKAAEAFYVQKTLPGHFDNFQELVSEMLGNPPGKPKIY